MGVGAALAAIGLHEHSRLSPEPGMVGFILSLEGERHAALLLVQR
jgi:hypothetical protein